MRRAFRSLVTAALLIFPVSLARAASFERSVLEVSSDRGSHRFQVELAISPEQRARGLMGRDSLPADSGMLFVFSEERPVSMWMRDTRIPLDMFFLATDGRILKIATAKPLSDEVIPSDGGVRGVLELAGGTADRLGIRPGDRVLHPAFRRKP